MYRRVEEPSSSTMWSSQILSYRVRGPAVAERGVAWRMEEVEVGAKAARRVGVKAEAPCCPTARARTDKWYIIVFFFSLLVSSVD